MKTLFIILLSTICSVTYAQKINGEIILEGRKSTYIDQVFVTNLTTNETTLVRFNGSFSIGAKEGHVLRFTSYKTDRKNLLINASMFEKENIFVELILKAKAIEEVVISRFRPSGNLAIDSKKLDRVDKSKVIKKAIGLPEPKNDVNNSPASFANGGFNISIESIYNVLSGEMKKRKRRERYEKMQMKIEYVRRAVDTGFFTKLKIPENLISNFLQFIYISENNNLTVDNVLVLTEKYLPIYLERLKNSHLLHHTEKKISMVFDN